MGLDMYLHAELYVSGWDHSKNPLFDELVTVLGINGYITPGSPSIEVRPTVAYWRKANHIHNWFVQEVQSGVDDCGTYYVSTEQLAELRDRCKKALELADTEPSPDVDMGLVITDAGLVPSTEVGRTIKNAEAVAELLPTTSGSFFGGTDYDEWYLRDLELTVEQIDKALELAEKMKDASFMGVSFYYHSSW